MSISSKYTSQKDNMEISSVESGYDSTRIELLNHHLQDLVERGRIQCASYLLSRNGKVFAMNSMGKLDFNDTKRSFMPDSIIRVGTLTKLFTTIAIMKLIENGKIYLEQPIKTIVPQFNTPLHGNINIFHLLTHTSGLCPDPGYFSEPYPIDIWSFFDQENWIDKVLEGTMHIRPGEAWNYSTAGFLLLGEIIARVSGEKYTDFVIKNIIEPLGMSRTFFVIPEGLYDQVCKANKWDQKFISLENKIAAGAPPAGTGIFSTLEDLWKLGQMLLNKGTVNSSRILGRKTVETMTKYQRINLPAYYWGKNMKNYEYGLGCGVTSDITLTSPDTFYHEGSSRCALYIDPTENFVAIYFVPCQTDDWIAESMVCTRSIIWSGII